MKKIAKVLALLAAMAVLALAGCKNASNSGPDTVTCAHHYVGEDGVCKYCGLQKPKLEGGEIDEYGVLTKYTGTETDVVIPDGVTSIGKDAFFFAL